MHPQQKADFDWYFTHAVQLADGGGYVWNGHPTAYWPIGWPFILSLVIRIFGPHMMAGLFTNVVFSICIVVLVYFITLAIFKSRPAAVTASIAYTLLPSHLLWNSILGSEESFTLLLLLSIYLYLLATKRNKSWFWLLSVAGLVMGFATDVRPIPLLFPICLICYEWFLHRRRWLNGFQRVLTFSVFMAIGVLPVTIRNWIVMKHFILVSTNGGVNLWQGTHTDGGYFWSWLPWINPLLKAGNNEILSNQIGQQAAEKFIFAHPLSTAHHGFLKIIDLYKNDINSVWYTFHEVSPGLTNTMNSVCNTTYFLFMLLALVGLVALARHRCRGKFAVLPLLWIVYNTAIFVFFPAWDRFRYPMMPLFAIFLGYGVAWLIPAWRRTLPRAGDQPNR